jgi:hypothetical protein
MKYTLPEFIKYLQSFEAEYPEATIGLDQGEFHTTDIEINVGTSLFGQHRLLISEVYEVAPDEEK